MEWSLNAPGLCPWERGRKLVSIRLFISRSEFTSNAVDEFLSKLNNFNGLRSYCEKWCLTIDSSGGRVDVGHFDSIVEFHPSNHLGQIMESS